MADAKRNGNPAEMASAIDGLAEGLGSLGDEMVELQKRAALGAVAGLLAHEVNNILTPVLAYVRLAQRADADDQAVQRALDEAESGVRRTTEIASAILSLGRGGGRDASARANVLDVIRQSAATLGRDLSRDGITCRIVAPEDIDAAIEPTPLQQVLVNLLQNARSAILSSKRGRGSISVTCSTWNTDRVRIEVADDGPGISEAARKRMFEPFVRGGNGTAGTGLGLTVCRELLRAAKGDISFTPSESGGATFVIDLPAAPKETAVRSEAA
ncbi:MAG: HAMP domain-containing sensor histidine kinase [Planctomycetota bacterium]